MKRCKLLLAIVGLLSSFSLYAGVIDIAKRGAKGDGKTDNTSIIQKAIDECSQNGGGKVFIPSGIYLIRPVELKSNVNLHLDFGAVLLGSTRLSDYDVAFPIMDGTMNQSSGLIYARKQRNISITGFGTIDGQGGSSTFQFGNDADGGPKRPKIIYLVECKGIMVHDVTLRNSAYWVQHYEKCEDLFIRGVKVFSHCNYNNDGLDIDAKNAVVSDCYIDVEDDAICFKSDHESFCENITVTNCVTASNCNAIKFGTASHGGFRNIVVSNCVVRRAAEDNIRHWSKQLEYISADVTVISGVSIEMVDGGVIDGITISNISMKDVQTPIFVRLGDRSRTYRKEGGVLRNINISDIVAKSESLISCSVTGIEGHCVENVSINNVQITYPGGGTNEMVIKQVPEEVKSYPENRMFGNTLPGAGFYVRHVRNIRFNNVRFTALLPDKRPLYFLDDVRGAEFNNCLGVDSADADFIYSVRSSEILSDGKLLFK